jgi:cyclopropane-fatty-acyl-phospholipid synthase
MLLAESFLRTLFARAGIRVGGGRPWDIRVHDRRFYGRVLRLGSLGLGESFMDGWWDCDRLDRFFHRLLACGIDRWTRLMPAALVARARHRLAAPVTTERAFHIGEAHYDLGNDLFTAMLDPLMTYSCGYWRPQARGARGRPGLGEAQQAKLDLVCRKLTLRPGQRVLDIGCGWGSFARFAAERYGAEVVGITVSKEQAEMARRLCADLPVEIRFADYRKVAEVFDHVVSIGMFEHVEPANYRIYFETAARCLAPSGVFLLHTIGTRDATDTDPWLRKYIFPLGTVPVARQIRSATRGLFQILDWHALGPRQYDRTLMAWYANFTARWPALAAAYAGKLAGRFERMWRYYLLCCAGAFRARHNDVWQIAMARESLPSYEPAR